MNHWISALNPAKLESGATAHKHGKCTQGNFTLLLKLYNLLFTVKVVKPSRYHINKETII